MPGSHCTPVPLCCPPLSTRPAAQHDLYDPDGSIQNALQTYVLANASGPRVPIMFVEECLHGVQQAGKTVFPQQIASAASFDGPLLQRIGAAIAKEARAYGIVQCFAPVIGTAREPRWGRVQETYGEDVFLTSVLAYNVRRVPGRAASPVVRGVRGA
jgi:beta-glucosidase-like glycosyl hydrolase